MRGVWVSNRHAPRPLRRHRARRVGAMRSVRRAHEPRPCREAAIKRVRAVGEIRPRSVGCCARHRRWPSSIMRTWSRSTTSTKATTTSTSRWSTSPRDAAAAARGASTHAGRDPRRDASSRRRARGQQGAGPHRRGLKCTRFPPRCSRRSDVGSRSTRPTAGRRRPPSWSRSGAGARPRRQRGGPARLLPPELVSQLG